jgi:hypothetical protein
MHLGYIATSRQGSYTVPADGKIIAATNGTWSGGYVRKNGSGVSVGVEVPVSAGDTISWYVDSSSYRCFIAYAYLT